MVQILWLIKWSLCIQVNTASNSWRRHNHVNIFLAETATQVFQKGSPPWPSHRGKAVSPCAVMYSKEKHCWLRTHTSPPCWHFWASNTDTGCFKRAWGHTGRWAGGSSCPRNGTHFRDWVTGPEYSSRDVSTAVWTGCLCMRSKAYPIASPLQHRV